MVSYKDVQNLAGYTTLVYEMKEVLDDLQQGKYKRMMVNNNGEENKDGVVPASNKRVHAHYMDNSLSN